MKKIILVAVIILVIAGIILVRGTGRTEDPVRQKQLFLMDTVVSIKIPAPAAVADPVIDAAFKRISEIDEKFNCLNQKSPVYQFNNNGTPITDTEIIRVIKEAQQISAETDGAFDITVEPLVRLWGFFTDKPRVPTPGEIKESLTNVGYQHLIVTDDRVTSDRPGIRIDLGGIAKGYAIAEAIKLLKARGITAALVEAGQVYGFGCLPDGSPWKIGIRNPRKEGFVAGLAVPKELGITTSGDYERFFEKDGIRYHHIIDPKTGYPARKTMSMSVIIDNATLTDGDGWSTGLFVLGPEKALELVKKKPGMEIICVTAEGKVLTSPGLANRNLEKKGGD